MTPLSLLFSSFLFFFLAERETREEREIAERRAREIAHQQRSQRPPGGGGTATQTLTSDSGSVLAGRGNVQIVRGEEPKEIE
jgi:hypothetical protein